MSVTFLLCILSSKSCVSIIYITNMIKHSFWRHKILFWYRHYKTKNDDKLHIQYVYTFMNISNLFEHSNPMYTSFTPIKLPVWVSVCEIIFLAKYSFWARRSWTFHQLKIHQCPTYNIKCINVLMRIRMRILNPRFWCI